MGCWPNIYKLALITPKEWLEPGTGIMCRSCRFHQKVTPYHFPDDGSQDKCFAKRCLNVLTPEKGFPGLVLYHAGNETCENYEPEIVLNIDLSGLEARLLERLCNR